VRGEGTPARSEERLESRTARGVRMLGASLSHWVLAGFWSGSESGCFGPQDEHGGLASAEYGRDGGQRGYRG
jgi:hypothetical protein